ncbi:MAG: phosphoribosylanthranilate isomerase [Pirellulaceae bacterium]
MIRFTTKICGITNVHDGLAVAECGASAIGLNFYERSLRCVSQTVAAVIVSEIRSQFSNVQMIGLFVNASSDQIREKSDSIGFDAIQLHGDEPVEIANELAGLDIIRAVRVLGSDFIAAKQEIQRWQNAGVTDFLLDAGARGTFGGTGNQLEWSKLVDEFGESCQELILAGGLTPDNVEEAIQIVRPKAVDTASGVEGLPGKKDPKLVKDFVAAAGRGFERSINSA